MLRSMYSGISGMKANQTKLDVIGNNISNVGTTSFKASRAKFQDMLYQNVKDAMTPSTNQGGVNAKQVGLGVQLSSIDRIMTQGMMQPTNRALDVAIDGNGYFMVSSGPAVLGDNTLEVSHTAGSHNITDQSLSSSGSKIMYSRDGAFTLDESGNLLTSDGYRVLGYTLTNDDNAQAATAISPDGMNLSSINFSFGPGSQLNGYKIAFGKISPGTVASAEVDKTNKVIVINGDFSETSTLTTAQVESAVNKAVSSAGISQRVKASGEIPAYASIGTKAIEGGSDATAPDSVRLVGVQINFEKGEELNGYSFKINEIANGGSTTAAIDTTNKVITISTDLSTAKPEDIVNAVNAQLSATTNPETTAVFAQRLKSGTGVVSPISGTEVTAAGATATTAPTATIQGLNITLPTGTLTDYNISINRVNGPTPATAAVDTTNHEIVINGDFLTPSTNLAADLQAAIAAVLPGSTVTGNGKALSGLDSTTIQGGAKDSKPSDQEAFGMKFTFAEGASLNGYKIQIGKITKGTELSTAVDEKSKTITINGDFTTTPTTLDNNKIQASVRKALNDKGITQLVTVANTPKTISEAITAIEITGGTPVQSLNSDGTISFVDATKDLKSYDGALKSLKIPETVVVPGTGQELKVKSYTIDKTGVISAILEDGSVAALGQIAMASFRNPEGLTSLGKNLYEASANSGGATIKSGLETTGEDNSAGYGDNVQGMLEMSNVDLAEQFTDMIVTNRAFQASGKMITTGDEILQDIINLKR